VKKKGKKWREKRRRDSGGGEETVREEIYGKMCPAI
jgi:hypothetical protein